MKNLSKPKPYSTSLKKPKPENFETEPALLPLNTFSKKLCKQYMICTLSKLNCSVSTGIRSLAISDN